MDKEYARHLRAARVFSLFPHFFFHKNAGQIVVVINRFVAVR